MAECYTAVKELARALSNYFTKQGPMVLDYIEITRQREVKVSLRAIVRHYEGSETMPYLSDALRALGGETFINYLKERLNWDLVVLEGESYLRIPSDRYRECVGRPYEFFKELLDRYCLILTGTQEAGGSQDSASPSNGESHAL